MTLAATARAVGLARQATHEALASWRVAHVAETAALLVSELVTNAVRHAQTDGSAVVLRLETAGSWRGSRSMTPTRRCRSRARRTGSRDQASDSC
ncbi:MAG TPA: hypothetical protein VGQ26_24950 [Streptosporangiaceae bacterium]|nr:hypothetical protein [Streptosporangiaceae bacterium]